MVNFGTDFERARSGWLYAGSTAYGFWVTLVLTLLLVIVNQVFQFAGGIGALLLLKDGTVGSVLEGLVTDVQAAGGQPTREILKAFLIGLLPASLLTGLVAWWFASLNGGHARDRLALHRPKFSWTGWIVTVGGFIVAMYVFIVALVVIFNIDVSQYAPGPDGQSPETGSAGLVKETIFDLANEPLLFWPTLGSIMIGAPLAEELIFRGQFFTALRKTWLGGTGATVISSAVWSLMHITEPWFAIGLIFVMGLVLGFLLLRFGSLLLTMVCHGAWNGLFALLVYGGLANG